MGRMEHSYFCEENLIVGNSAPPEAIRADINMNVYREAMQTEVFRMKGLRVQSMSGKLFILRSGRTFVNTQHERVEFLIFTSYGSGGVTTLGGKWIIVLIWSPRSHFRGGFVLLNYHSQLMAEEMHCCGPPRLMVLIFSKTSGNADPFVFASHK